MPRLARLDAPGVPVLKTEGIAERADNLGRNVREQNFGDVLELVDLLLNLLAADPRIPGRMKG